jgi:chemotaxis protein methyltransferase WspC
MKTIEALLRERIGLDCSALGVAAIERIVRRRMQHLELRELSDYRELLLASSREYGELLEAVVVTETWFFRDPEALATLVRIAVEEWVPRYPPEKMRILSLPCASGEEPYSIVMALLDGSVPPNRFHIDAMDISTRCLARAAKSAYGKNAFRSKDLSFQERHFRQVGEEYILNPGARRLAHFMQGNLLGSDFATAHPSYDFIFCRNLLIYLDRAAQARALERMERLLTSEGLLFLAPAEQAIALDWGFVSSKLPLSFACRKRTNRGSCSARLDTTPPMRGLGDTPSLARSSSPPVQPDLGQARRLADAGELTEAAAICEAYLRRTEPSAQAYYLLGLVRDARGDPSAIECYRKALYLEPNHYETLVQLAVLAHKNGDSAGALHLQRRAERLQPPNAIEL